MTRNFIKQTDKMNFRDVLNCIENTHTLSTKKICEILKTYRPWVSKYILPYLNKVFIGSKYSGSLNWLSAAKKTLNRDDLTESAWYKTNDFKELLKKSLVSSTRQTIRVSPGVFVSAFERQEFTEKINELKNKMSENHTKQLQIKTVKGFDKKDEVMEEKNILESSYKTLLDEKIGSKIMEELHRYIQNPTLEAWEMNPKRPLSSPINYSFEWDYMDFNAVHDMKGYGGIDEIIYRELFKYGAVKLIFNFTAKNGDKGEKVFYVYDKQNDDKYILDQGEIWTVPYSFFLKYKKI